MQERTQGSRHPDLSSVDVVSPGGGVLLLHTWCAADVPYRQLGPCAGPAGALPQDWHSWSPALGAPWCTESTAALAQRAPGSHPQLCMCIACVTPYDTNPPCGRCPWDRSFQDPCITTRFGFSEPAGPGTCFLYNIPEGEGEGAKADCQGKGGRHMWTSDITCGRSVRRLQRAFGCPGPKSPSCSGSCAAHSRL